MKNPIKQTVLLNRLPARHLHLLRQIGRLADERGVSVYLVGGVVRDLLLKRENWDLDLAVEGDGIAFARAVADRYGAGLAVFERFATARLVFPDGLKMDIATTRREFYGKPAALPDVTPASLQEDLYRRDFTINAMAIQLNPATFGELHDPYEGQRDLKAKTIRVLHEGSFIDDPTRIFRAIRFTQRFGFSLEPSTRHLLEEAAATKLVHQLSGPRLCNEILLLLGERDPRKPIKSLVLLRLLRFLHPRLRYTKKGERVVAVLPRALAWWKKQCPDHVVERPLIYLMALLSQAGPAVLRSVIQRLQLSSLQSKAVERAGRKTDQLVQVLVGTKDMRPARVYRLLAGLPDDAIVLLVAKGLAMRKGGGMHRHRLTRRLSRFLKHDRRATTIVRGEDLKRLGLKPGPQFKKILDRLLDARLNGHVRTESDEWAFVHRVAQQLG
jgi:tRNA nucleotidyltransferase (CCA-adding enzyme)